MSEKQKRKGTNLCPNVILTLQNQVHWKLYLILDPPCHIIYGLQVQTVVKREAPTQATIHLPLKCNLNIGTLKE